MAKWIDATITDISNENERVKNFWLHPQMEASITAIPGQFITFDLPIGEKRLQRWKSYSIANFVTDGKIQFLSDCHHRLAGQTVDLHGVEEF